MRFVTGWIRKEESISFFTKLFNFPVLPLYWESVSGDVRNLYKPETFGTIFFQT